MSDNVSKVWTVFLGIFVLAGCCVFVDIALGIAAPPMPLSSELMQFTQAAQQSLHIIEGLLVTVGGLIVYIFRTSMKALGDSIKAVTAATQKNAEEIEDVKDNYLSIKIHDRSCINMAGKIRRENIKQVAEEG